MGSVINAPEGDPEKGLWVGCWRAGEERPNLEKVSLRRLAGESCLMLCWAGLYTLGFQGGPGEIGVPNSYWLLTWDTVDAEST